MDLSRLSAKCQDCPFVEHCKNKRMEALADLPDPVLAESTQSNSMSAAAPLLRETMKIRVNGETIIVYKDEIEKEIRKSLYFGYSDLGLQYGG